MPKIGWLSHLRIPMQPSSHNLVLRGGQTILDWSQPDPPHHVIYGMQAKPRCTSETVFNYPCPLSRLKIRDHVSVYPSSSGLLVLDEAAYSSDSTTWVASAWRGASIRVASVQRSGFLSPPICPSRRSHSDEPIDKSIGIEPSKAYNNSGSETCVTRPRCHYICTLV
jgi:hypothetical protein